MLKSSGEKDGKLNILAIGAHPDDVEIGCGGTLLKMKEEHGHKIFMLVMTFGDYGGSPKKRAEEQNESARYMGVSKVYWGEQKDTEIPVNNTTVSKIEKLICECKADLVLLNHPNDTHQDHRAVANCAISATRFMKRVLTYELNTSVDFSPNVFVDIEDYIERKEELLAFHSSQLKKKNGSRVSIAESVKAFAVFRGYQAQVKYAEGFAAHRLMIDNF